MIKELVKRFMDNKGELARVFAQAHPSDYADLVKSVVTFLSADPECPQLDPQRIHQIDDGDYQGTLIYVIAAQGYQPYEYWYTNVSYGSCSGCDTLESIRDYCDEKPTPQQVVEYMTLALHIVQRMKKMNDDEPELMTITQADLQPALENKQSKALLPAPGDSGKTCL